MTKEDAVKNLRQAVRSVLESEGAVLIASHPYVRKAINWCFHAHLTIDECRVAVSEEIARWIDEIRRV